MTQAEAGERGAKVRFPPPLVYLISILLGVAIRESTTPVLFPFCVEAVSEVD
jgi:hypothetical protein